MHLGMCGYVRGMGLMRCTADAYACVGMCMVCAHHFLQHFLCILCGMCGYVRMHLGYVRGMCVDTILKNNLMNMLVVLMILC